MIPRGDYFKQTVSYTGVIKYCVFKEEFHLSTELLWTLTVQGLPTKSQVSKSYRHFKTLTSVIKFVIRGTNTHTRTHTCGRTMKPPFTG